MFAEQCENIFLRMCPLEMAISQCRETDTCLDIKLH